MLTLKYKLRGESVNATVYDLDDAIKFLDEHRSGKIATRPEGFGNSDLLTTPTVYDGDKVVAKLNYNGTIQ